MFTNFRYTINFPIDDCDTEKIIKKINKQLKIKLMTLAQNSEDYNAVYNGDKYSIILSDGYGFINFAELDKEYICNIMELLGKGLGFNKKTYDILLDNKVVDNETKEEFMLIEEDGIENKEVIEFRYEAYFAFQNKNAYNLLNSALGYNLKNKTDEYNCEKYRLKMNTKFLHVYFKELDTKFIKDTMNKIVCALGETEWYWDVKDEQEDCFIDEPVAVEEEEEEYIVPVPKKQKPKVVLIEEEEE
jgi:hypothetical protein